MKNRLAQIPALALAAMLGFGTAGILAVDAVAPQTAVARDVDVGFFYSNLAPHGQWSFQANFGWVWHPGRVATGWRPYTEGRWDWSDDVGWVWVSYEPWGWATYHYGRWYFDPIFGWTWVPGNTWAPAWVSWRVQSGFIGWAPLWPVYFDTYPQYRWDSWHHDYDWDRRHHGRDWDRWVFCRDRDFVSDRVGRYAINDYRERDRIFRDSRDVTRWDSNRSERIGHSLDRSIVERASGKPVRRVRLEDSDRPVERRQGDRGDTLRVYRPRVRETTDDRTPDRLGVAKEPPREARETDTLRQEKERLDRVPAEKRLPPEKEKAGRGRERSSDRGGAPVDVERRTAPAATGVEADRPGRGQQDPAERDRQGRGQDPRDQQPGAKPDPMDRERPGGPDGRGQGRPDETGSERGAKKPAPDARQPAREQQQPGPQPERGKPQRAVDAPGAPQERGKAPREADQQRMQQQREKQEKVEQEQRRQQERGKHQREAEQQRMQQQEREKQQRGQQQREAEQQRMQQQERQQQQQMQREPERQPGPPQEQRPPQQQQPKKKGGDGEPPQEEDPRVPKGQQGR